MSQEQREQYFRIKSAKKEKLRSAFITKEREKHEWEYQEYSQKIKNVQQKKKMIDQQEDAERQKKLQEYNKKADEIKRRIQTMHNNFTSERSHMDSAGMSGGNGLEEYESGGYQSAVDYNNELEI